MIDEYLFDGVDDSIIRKEKAKARELRKSGWWKNKIAQGVCHYCSREISPGELTMDHIVPLARGGTSTKGNLATTCKECNNKKKTMLPIEWEEYMAQLEKK
jgi:5-methylcytosine-specific restriction endonuclease McrA